MANFNYTPTSWIGGKTVGTADVMNNIENGIVNSYAFTTSVLNVLNGHLSNHPSGGVPEPATDEEINNIFTIV